MALSGITDIDRYILSTFLTESDLHTCCLLNKYMRDVFSSILRKTLQSTFYPFSIAKHFISLDYIREIRRTCPNIECQSVHCIPIRDISINDTLSIKYHEMGKQHYNVIFGDGKLFKLNKDEGVLYICGE